MINTDKLYEALKESKEYTDKKVEEARNELINVISEYIQNPWTEFNDDTN